MSYFSRMCHLTKGQILVMNGEPFPINSQSAVLVESLILHSLLYYQFLTEYLLYFLFASVHGLVIPLYSLTGV